MPGPLTFVPLFMERVWGGRRLAELFGKPLPDDLVIGESWELVDRPEAQSVVAAGPLAGLTLHELWTGPHRAAIFGDAPDAPRFPVLVKLLDCVQTLSVQVHPGPHCPEGEPKTELWVILEATEGAQLLAGLRAGVTREHFETALRDGADVSALLQHLHVGRGDAMFLPSGRVHAIGAGNVIAEIQQNSDTTYRVYDFERPGLDGKLRELHVEQSLASIDWEDVEPSLLDGSGERLVRDDAFTVDRLVLGGAPRAAAPGGTCAVVLVADGTLECGGARHPRGTTLLVPPDGGELSGDATVLRVLL